MTDYSLWEVIKNGNKVLKRTVRETKQEYKPTTAEEKQDRRNEMKARGTLLMALPNKDQLKFHSYKDAKLLMEAIEKRYGGNKESKKVQRTLLKQQYDNFAGLSSETMDQTFDRLQKLISQLEIQGEEIETISLDDLYNNLKIYEPKILRSSSTSQNPQNVAFVSSNSTNSNSSTNEADNTAYGVSVAHTQCNPTSGDNLSDAVICAFLASQPNSPQLSHDDLEQINPDDLEEMDLQWEMAMLTIRARIFIKRTRRKLDVNGQRVGFDRSKVECYNFHKYGHFARECRAPRNQENRGREINRRTVTVETPTENFLVTQDGIRGYDWSYQAEEEHPTNFTLMAHTSSRSSSSSDFEVDSCSKSCVKAYDTLKEQYDSLSSDYKRSQFNLVSYKAGLESVEARLAHYKKNEAVFEESINVLKLEVKLRDTALVENKKKLEKAEKERDELKLTLEKFQNSSKSLNNLLESQVIDKFKTGLGYNAASSTAASPAVESFVNSSEMLENQENNKSKSDKGYHAVPPPFTGNFIPRKPDLTFMDEIVESENMDVTTVVTPSNVNTVESNLESAGVKSNDDAVEPKIVRKNSFRPPVIEDWNSNDKSEVEIIPKDKTVSSSTEKIKFVKTARETVEKSSGPINLVADETVYKEWEDRMERAATTASSLDAEQNSSNSLLVAMVQFSKMGGRVKKGINSSQLSPHHTPITIPSTVTTTTSSTLQVINKVLALETDLQQNKEGLKSVRSSDAAKVTYMMVARVHKLIVRRMKNISIGSGEEITSSSRASKDKGKAIMTEYKRPEGKNKERAGYEAAIKLQEQLDQEESQRIARDAEIALRLQEEIDATGRQRMAKVHQAA
ncbi:ribonuclease H-like domain-containing protein [Tanacetum coccineum]